MTHRFLASLHVWLSTLADAAAHRLRTAPQTGQGTVEYVALIMLVAGVLAVAVGAATSTKFRFDDVITGELSKAIKSVSSAAK